MKKTLVLLACLTSFSLLSFAQKVDISKDNKIMVDKTPIANIEKDGCGAFSIDCIYYISNLNDEPLITATAHSIILKSEISQYNPKGEVVFFRISFNGIDDVAEIPYTLKAKSLAQTLVKAKLIKDNKLDENAVNNFVKSRGTTFSDKAERENTKKVIILN